MPAHNTVLEVPCHAHKWMTHQVLRGEFGFGDGIALSDCNDLGALVDFGIAANNTHAAAKALNAGAVDLDLQCGSHPETWSYNNVVAAVNTGLTNVRPLVSRERERKKEREREKERERKRERKREREKDLHFLFSGAVSNPSLPSVLFRTFVVHRSN